MKKETAVRKNLDLLDTFMKYAFDYPDILDKIPPDAELVIFPKDDPALLKENRKLAESMTKAGEKVVIVELKKPRIAKPHLAVVNA
ncbi:MAG: hypothetical protein HY758_11425 [Nitrospirae bacterium]|nr:hypothetical protein [Nitrospirota bacterium]